MRHFLFPRGVLVFTLSPKSRLVMLLAARVLNYLRSTSLLLLNGSCTMSSYPHLLSVYAVIIRNPSQIMATSLQSYPHV